MRLRQLIADDRKLAECRLQDLALQFGMTDEDDAQRGGQQQQQRKQRHEGVVGDQRSQIAALVINILVDHRNDEAHRAVSLLQPVQPAHHLGHSSQTM